MDGWIGISGQGNVLRMWERRKNWDRLPPSQTVAFSPLKGQLLPPWSKTSSEMYVAPWLSKALLRWCCSLELVEYCIICSDWTTVFWDNSLVKLIYHCWCFSSFSIQSTRVSQCLAMVFSESKILNAPTLQCFCINRLTGNTHLIKTIIGTELDWLNRNLWKHLFNEHCSVVLITIKCWEEA